MQCSRRQEYAPRAGRRRARAVVGRFDTTKKRMDARAAHTRVGYRGELVVARWVRREAGMKLEGSW
eukprot:scaffold99828_cov63-Phaeocystis_antarctica.AAC.1